MTRERLTTWTIGQDRPETVCQYLGQQAEAGVQYFCFDYFDTLVVRDIEPEYSKQLAARLHSQLLNNLIPPEQLYALRQQLERELCEQSQALGGELEFYLHTFASPYRTALQQELGNIPALEDAARFTQQILSIETVVERAVQQPCEEAIRVLAWLRSQGLATVLISDFYLPSPWFLVMVESMGIRQYFDHLYISADHGVAKSSGRLYQQVCTELGCLPGQMLMIGDNLTSDVTRPDDLGMPSLYLLNPCQKAFTSAGSRRCLANPPGCASVLARRFPKKGSLRRSAAPSGILPAGFWRPYRNSRSRMWSFFQGRGVPEKTF